MPFFKTTDNTELHFIDWGAGEPVVFVSAWGLSCRMWQYQMTQVVDFGRRTVTYDRRGHGRSEDPGRGYDYDQLSDDLASLLNHLDLWNATLVSHSMGEGEIVRYLSRYGSNRIARVALISPLGPLPVAADDNPVGLDRDVIDSVRNSWKLDFPSWLDANQDSYVGKGLPGCNVSDGLVDWTKRDLLQTSLMALIECNRTGMETDRRTEMQRIDVPTLIIQGDHDASIPIELSGKVCAQLIPGAVLRTYANAPHGLYLSHANRLTGDLVGFFSTTKMAQMDALRADAAVLQSVSSASRSTAQ